ncbi:MAG: HigA family addiction module antidote protein [Acidobacteria bacterium]|nr:HigA family addiction module antidote protein [Acidobacteriota bacterium]
MSTLSGKPRHPGEVLLTHFLKPQNIAVEAAAQTVGLPADVLLEVVAGARSVTPDLALALAQLTRTVPEFWIRLQDAVDAHAAKGKVAGMN